MANAPHVFHNVSHVKMVPAAHNVSTAMPVQTLTVRLNALTENILQLLDARHALLVVQTVSQGDLPHAPHAQQDIFYQTISASQLAHKGIITTVTPAFLARPSV